MKTGNREVLDIEPFTESTDWDRNEMGISGCRMWGWSESEFRNAINKVNAALGEYTRRRAETGIEIADEWWAEEDEQE